MPLLLAGAPSRLALERVRQHPGPPFDLIDRVFLAVVDRVEPRVEAKLVRPGFYPARWRGHLSAAQAVWMRSQAVRSSSSDVA